VTTIFGDAAHVGASEPFLVLKPELVDGGQGLLAGDEHDLVVLNSLPLVVESKVQLVSEHPLGQSELVLIWPLWKTLAEVLT
jgi:hypothetical protein